MKKVNDDNGLNDLGIKNGDLKDIHPYANDIGNFKNENDIQSSPNEKNKKIDTNKKVKNTTTLFTIFLIVGSVGLGIIPISNWIVRTNAKANIEMVETLDDFAVAHYQIENFDESKTYYSILKNDFTNRIDEITLSEDELFYYDLKYNMQYDIIIKEENIIIGKTSFKAKSSR